MPGGRPTKYSPEMLEKTKLFFDSWEPYFECPIEIQDKEGNVSTKMERQPNPPPTYGELAKKLGVTRSTVWLWTESHPEFSSIYKKLSKKCFEEGMMTAGIMGKYNPSISIFAAKNKLGWTDRQEVTNKFPEPVIFQNPDGITIKKVDFKDANN